jgi:DNA modification methylase
VPSVIRDRVVELRRVRTGDLLPDPRNWRRHLSGQATALRSMLEQVGFADALLARETPEGLRLIDGHLRAELTPEDTVPVLVLDLDEAEAGAVLATLDPLAAMAAVDQDSLRGLLAEISLPDGEVAAMMARLSSAPATAWLTDPDDIPAAPEEPRTRPGDCWILGRHRLLCADASSSEAVDRILDGAAVDLVVTSPPYNVGIDYAAYDDAEVSRENYLAFLRSALEPWINALGSGRFCAWNVGVSARTYHLHQGLLLEELGLTLKRQIVWVKAGVPLPTFQHTRAASRARRYTPDYRHEVIYLASKGEPEDGAAIPLPTVGVSDVWDHLHQSQATRDLPTGSSERRSRRRQSGLERHAVKAHPAAFPVGLPETLMGYLSAPEEVVLDPFLGSGSTLIAAERTGRRGFGVELDPTYCDVAVARWERYTGLEAVRQDG